MNERKLLSQLCRLKLINATWLSLNNDVKTIILEKSYSLLLRSSSAIYYQVTQHPDLEGDSKQGSLSRSFLHHFSFIISLWEILSGLGCTWSQLTSYPAIYHSQDFARTLFQSTLYFAYMHDDLGSPGKKTRFYRRILRCWDSSHILWQDLSATSKRSILAVMGDTIHSSCLHKIESKGQLECNSIAPTHKQWSTLSPLWITSVRNDITLVFYILQKMGAHWAALPTRSRNRFCKTLYNAVTCNNDTGTLEINAMNSAIENVLKDDDNNTVVCAIFNGLKLLKATWHTVTKELRSVMAAHDFTLQDTPRCIL